MRNVEFAPAPKNTDTVEMGRPKVEMFNEDGTGKTFGFLTVKSEDGERASDGSMKYKCDCICGTEVSVKGSYLRGLHTKSCGCCGSPVRPGAVINFISVESLAYRDKSGQSYWNCSCLNCGNTKIMRNSNILYSMSCGCMARSKDIESLKKMTEDSYEKYGKPLLVKAIALGLILKTELSKNNTSGYTGVSENKKRGNYEWYINIGKEVKELLGERLKGYPKNKIHGYACSALEAAIARETEITKLGIREIFDNIMAQICAVRGGKAAG